MANYSTLLAAIAANIYTNGNNEVTAAMVKSAVVSMVSSLGAGYQFAGMATPDTDPGTPDQRVFYIAATDGVYTNFGGLSVEGGDVVVLYWDTMWHLRSFGTASEKSLRSLAAEVEGTNKNYVAGGYNSSGGNAGASGWGAAIDYIPCNYMDTIVWNPGAINNGVALVMYDSAKNYINYYLANANTRTLTMSSDPGLAYIRPSFAISNIASAKIIRNGVEVWHAQAQSLGINDRAMMADVKIIDAQGGNDSTLTLNAAAKEVTISSDGVVIQVKDKRVILKGPFTMSYSSASYPNGQWLLDWETIKQANNGDIIPVDGSVIYYAPISDTSTIGKNIVLFPTYYDSIPPAGAFGLVLLKRMVEELAAGQENLVNDAKCQEFAALLNNTAAVETFAFMTDPHLLGSNNVFDRLQFENYIGTLEQYYKALPLSSMICGGDWLNFGDTQVSAIWKLGYADGQMRKRFPRYFPLLGNHDTNYQGVVSADNPSRGDLTHQTLINVMFREEGNTYYRFDGATTRFYVFDTQLDWSASMDTFKWEQIDWFATSLLSDTSPRIVVLQHMFYTSGTSVAPISTNIQSVIGAYNARQSVTLNGRTYDFSAVTGKIYCVIAGHTHADAIITVGVSVPVWLTTNMMDGGTPTFDLMVIDYGAGKLKSVRVGTGANRSMNLA